MNEEIADVLAGRRRWCVVTGDCLDILPTLPDGCVDAVVTDIPYGEVNRDGGGLRVLDKGAADATTFDHSWATRESARISTGSVYIWCGTEQVSDIRRTMVGLDMTTRLCVWEKSNPSPMNGEHFWLSSVEACVFGRHSRSHFGRFCESPVWRGPSCRESPHPTPKPFWLMRISVEASVPDDGVVLDFCCGGGSTGVAAIKTGRRFIGIEIDPAYADIARRRIAEADTHLFNTSNEGSMNNA